MRRSKMLTVIFFLALVSCVQEKHLKTIHFKVQTNPLDKFSSVGIRGSIAPLSWDKIIELVDHNDDGLFEGKIELKTAQNFLEFKFVHSDSIFELANKDNRYIQFNYEPQKLNYDAVFNQNNSK